MYPFDFKDGEHALVIISRRQPSEPCLFLISARTVAHKILTSFYIRKCSVKLTDWCAPSTGDTGTVVAFLALPRLSAPLCLELLVLETARHVSESSDDICVTYLQI